jgi:hypothetical protein
MRQSDAGHRGKQGRKKSSSIYPSIGLGSPFDAGEMYRLGAQKMVAFVSANVGSYYGWQM